MTSRRGFFAAVVGMASALFAPKRSIFTLEWVADPGPETVFEFTERALRERKLQTSHSADMDMKLEWLGGTPKQYRITSTDTRGLRYDVICTDDDILLQSQKDSASIRITKEGHVFLDGVVHLGCEPWARS